MKIVLRYASVDIGMRIPRHELILPSCLDNHAREIHLDRKLFLDK